MGMMNGSYYGPKRDMAKRKTAKPDPSPTPAEPSAGKPARPRAPRQTAGTARTTSPKTSKGRKAVKTESPDRLHILMVTPEARPFAKTGGLADVCGALPPALARLGHEVTLVLPRYRGIDAGDGGRAASIPLGSRRYAVRFVERPVSEGVRAMFVDAPDLYDREGLYGDRSGDYRDNAFRFAVLSRAALEYGRQLDRPVSVIHAHDWQASLTAVYARTVLGTDPVIGRTPVVLTIHNLAFQGLFDAAELAWIGLGADLFRPDRLEYWGRASALKGGIVFSQKITTVSPTYAREILTREYGFGFEGILQARARDLSGILNGIDTDMWDPARDAQLPAPFGPDTLDDKRAVKRALLEAAGLPVDDGTLARPLIGLVSRLTQQKGFDLIADAMPRLAALGASWVMLGSGDRPYEEFWTAVATRFPDRMSARIGFDERLAHLIEGGADLFLMPSRYEPCGLNQMYSLRYGTIPVVFATGGLDDTVEDADAVPQRGTGFKFDRFTVDGLVNAVERALTAFRDTKRWRAIQRRGMGADFSWDVSAREYVKVFREAEDGIR